MMQISFAIATNLQQSGGKTESVQTQRPGVSNLRKVKHSLEEGEDKACMQLRIHAVEATRSAHGYPEF